jgi:exopolysaccharide biosynthesis predicted pyruvyltransferase EpsI
MWQQVSKDLRDSPINSPIREFLSEFRGKRIAYFPNPGNAGDSLIATGTMHLFDELDISFDNITYEDDVDGRIVVLGGGGNLIQNYGQIRRAIEIFSPKAKLLVLLPHTIRGAEVHLARLARNSYVFCRDVPSYEHVLSVSDLPNVYLAHDMAFNLNIDRLLGDKDLAAAAGKRFKNKMEQAQIDEGRFHDAGLVRLFRGDREQKIKIRDNVADISALFAFGVQLDSAYQSAWCFMKFIEQCNTIATDRLHVGIGSAILGKNTHLFDNNYGKNYGIFQHSLRKARENINFYRVDGAIAPAIIDLVSEYSMDQRAVSVMAT